MAIPIQIDQFSIARVGLTSLFAFLLALTGCGSSVVDSTTKGEQAFMCTDAVGGHMSVDSTEYIVMINGKEMAFPLVYSGVNGRVYYRCENFMEHDTIFFDREYQFYRCDTCHKNELFVSSYFLTLRTAPDHDEAVRGQFWQWSHEKHKEYYEETLQYLHSIDSTVELTQEELGDVPRIWCPLVKREGQYFLSIDNPYTFEFTDSLIIFHGMELYLCPLRNFQKVNANEYRYEYAVAKGGWYHVVLRRSNKVKDLWIQIKTTPSDKQFVDYEPYTPMECIGNFDYINYSSNDHIPEGLCGYEEVSPED